MKTLSRSMLCAVWVYLAVVTLAACSGGETSCSDVQSIATKTAQDIMSESDRDSPEVMNDGNDGADAEKDCAKNSTGDQRDRHLVSAAHFLVTAAVYGQNGDFGLHKGELDQAKDALQYVLDDPAASAKTRNDANDMMESVEEKEGAQ